MCNKKIMRSQQVFKSQRNVASTIQMKKIALSNNGDKRQIYFNRIRHAYGTNVGKTCKNELLTKVKRID